MKKRLWIIGSLVLVAAIATALFLLTTKGQEHPATVVETVNKVDARPRSRDDWQPAVADMTIHGGGQVRTGAESLAQLELLEGVVRLSADSIFTVKESVTRQGTLLTTLFLQKGRLWVNLAPDKPHEFAVETGNAVAAVRDTHFSVSVAGGETLLSVAEGEVELTAQEQSVTVTAEKQARVEPDQPPSLPEPLSDDERRMWATEGEIPELAPPTPTPVPTATPIKVTVEGDLLYCGLHGPAGDPASRNPTTGFDVRVEGSNEVQVAVELPSGKVVILPPHSDILGGVGRFSGSVQGLPQAGGTYTVMALDANGTPIPGAVASDVYVGGCEPDPPSNVRAEVVEAGILVTWDPSPAIPGAFDPGGSPPFGSYTIYFHREGGELPYTWGHDWSLPETSHLIPFRRRDFGPGDQGSALEEMDDGVYNLELFSFSVAPEGTAGQGTECIASDPAEWLRIVIEAGQVRIEKP